MNRIIGKLAQGGLLTMMGYEIGEKMSENSQQIVEKKITEVKEKDNDELILVLILMLIMIGVGVIVLIVKICIALNKRVRREEIEMQPRIV